PSASEQPRWSIFRASGASLAEAVRRLQPSGRPSSLPWPFQRPCQLCRRPWPVRACHPELRRLWPAYRPWASVLCLYLFLLPWLSPCLWRKLLACATSSLVAVLPFGRGFDDLQIRDVHRPLHHFQSARFAGLGVVARCLPLLDALHRFLAL